MHCTELLYLYSKGQVVERRLCNRGLGEEKQSVKGRKKDSHEL